MAHKTPLDDGIGRTPTSQRLRVIELDNGDKPPVTVSIDGKEIQVPVGATILEAAKALGIRIPTLCYHEDLCIAGVCRICVVEVEGQKTLQASCAYQITQPIVVHTHTRKVRQARRHILDLMLSEHYGECYSCVRNNNCELQSLAKEYGIDFYRFGHPNAPKHEIDRSNYGIVRDMNKCIQCRRCVRTCIDLQEVGVLEAIGRGKDVVIGTFMNKPVAEVICIQCGQCINRCPTGALHANDPSDEIWNAIDDSSKHVVIQTAPAPRAGIGEEFGLEPGHPLTFEMNTALRYCGFDKVFDTNFSADLTIIEEGTELILRLYKNLVQKDNSMPLPQMTSCSPGWITYVEHFYPEYLANVSSAKSPQQMFGTVIKTYYAKCNNIDPADIVSVSLMPCTAKKFESNRPEMCDSGYKDVDYVLTTRELAQMIREAGIHLPDMEKSEFDDPFDASGSGIIFGATGGVMEAALRTVLEFVTGKPVEDFYEHADIIPLRGFEGIRYVELQIPKEVGPVPEMIAHLVPNWDWIAGATLKIVVAHGTANIKKVLEDINAGGKFSQCQFIEFMACPGGCLGGGGQPIPTTPEIRAARAKAIYAEDASYGKAGKARKSHENPAVLQIYRDFLKEGPCGHRSHELLHTSYTPRGKYIG